MKKKAVLITGATKNTGLEIAEKFLFEGRTVFITSRNLVVAEEKAMSLKAKYSVDCYGLSYQPLESKEACTAIFSEISERGYLIDTLVCAHADPGFGQDVLTVSLTDWENIILANVMGAYIPARMMVNELIKSGTNCGTIVFIGSTLSNTAIPGRSAYVASKGALASMTKALALDFAQFGVRVNCVLPGPIQTERWDALSDEEAQNRGKTIPLGAPVTTKQVASVVWFLASEFSDGMTGASIVVDSGLDCVVPGAY